MNPSASASRLRGPLNSSTFVDIFGGFLISLAFSSQRAIFDPHSAPTDPDQADERGPFSEKVLCLRDEIASLSNEELAAMSAGLRKVLEGAAEGGAPAEEKAPEKTTFSVMIEKFDAGSKIKVIKEVRAICDLGLKEAKEFVEKVPVVLKDGLTKEEAIKLIEKLKAVVCLLRT
ncbi:hypothetical protein KP509_27G017000 [Ceratopteris richardii]|uniref:Large ribosomal subunit protein bL12 C-terminal domain-containing protein n=1 Tax=Ceratopteris richardii TaxID=49495 RepID=A0A8T2RGR3_CERRI|nr:hypothetical protein KP509_27G017000 [Ceratopteris richardii]